MNELSLVGASPHMRHATCASRKIDGIRSAALSDGFGPPHDLIREVFDALLRRPRALLLYLAKQALFEFGGAYAMLEYANKTADVHRETLRRHAGDEKRHFDYYAGFLKSQFGWTFCESALEAQIATEDDFLSRLGDDDVAFYSDTHTAEFRTQIKLDAFIDALRQSDQTFAGVLLKLVAKVRDDEAHHVTYTGKVLEALESSGVEVGTRLAESFAYSSKVGWIELAKTLKMIEAHPRIESV